MWDIETIKRINSNPEFDGRAEVVKAFNTANIFMLYRILTEDKNRTETVATMEKYFPKGFTLLPGAIGVWNGAREFSLVFEIQTDDGVNVILAAEEIKRANAQESVLVQRVPMEAIFV
jgi:hypothetical protein